MRINLSQSFPFLNFNVGTPRWVAPVVTSRSQSPAVHHLPTELPLTCIYLKNLNLVFLCFFKIILLEYQMRVCLVVLGLVAQTIVADQSRIVPSNGNLLVSLNFMYLHLLSLVHTIPGQGSLFFSFILNSSTFSSRHHNI